MTSRLHASLVLAISSAALLGTSAPKVVTVSIPPVKTTVPAGRMGQFRVVLTPEEDGGGENAFIVVAEHAGVRQQQGAKLFVVSDAQPDAPRLVVPVIRYGEADRQLTAGDTRGASRRNGDVTRVPLPPCKSTSCTFSYRVYTEPPTDVVLALQRPPRVAPRTGMFPFDSPDIDGTREAEAVRMRFFVQPTAPHHRDTTTK